MLQVNGLNNRTRKRSAFDTAFIGYNQFVPKGSTGVLPTWYTKNVRMQQLTIDRDNTGWTTAQRLLHSSNTSASVKRRLRRLDLGGEFYSERQEYTEPGVIRHEKTHLSPIVGTYNSYLNQYGVPVSNITPASTIWPTLDPEEDVELWGLGSSAIKAVAPVLPATSLSQTLGELREGLPRLAHKLGSISAASNSGASNYLGWQFGVKPLINDFKNISRSLSEYDKTLARFERESGELLHRKFRFDTVKDMVLESTNTQFAWPAPLSPTGPKQGVRNITLHREVDTWFSGAFSFYFPRIRSGIQELKTWADQMGVGLTPDTFWNLTPYTWLMDWFANFGDVIFNVSYLFNNSQIVNYGYLMRTTKHTRRVTWSPSGWGGTTQDFSVTRKLRIKASPFGFGASEGDLSPAQLAILAALGITRVT